MTDLSVIVTGIVGVAGIGGTILATRMMGKNQTANLILSINAQGEHNRLAEKRRIYARYQASLDNIFFATGRLRIHGGERFKDNFDAMFTEYVELHSALSELRLISAQSLANWHRT